MTKVRTLRTAALALLAIGAAGLLSSCSRGQAPPATAKERRWQLLASELPSALLSVSGRSPRDIYAVGADKGHGPLVLHFDGTRWKELPTGQHGDLWWVQALPHGPVLMAGASGMVLRYDGDRFERLKTPGLGRQTVYGVWGTDGDDFYAVGSANGRSGFVWHCRHGAFESEELPLEQLRMTSGELPAFFKVFGLGDEVWVVGAGGTVLRRQGLQPFAPVPTTTRDTLFTVHGTGSRLLTVGGAGNGVVLDGAGGAFHDASPAGAGLIQGIFATAQGDWASGERGVIYTRADPRSPFVAVDHGLTLPATSSLHAIFVDSAGGVWSAGGNVLTPALDGGMLIHYGDPIPPVVIEDDDTPTDAGSASACPAEVVAAGKTGSIARRWDEQALAAIRRDLPRPTVHARNLFHISSAMWDAWAGYDAKAAGVYVKERHTSDDCESALRAAISYAAYDVLVHRYRAAVGGPATLACLTAVMRDLGYDPGDSHDTGDDPVAFGNRIAHTIIARTAHDGADEESDYADPTQVAIDNPPLLYDGVGTTLRHADRWQPINLSVAATQNGIILPGGVQDYVGSQWGNVTPFALHRASSAVPWKTRGPYLGSVRR